MRSVLAGAQGRTTRTMVVTALVDWCGTGLWITVSALYFSRVVGLSTEQIGLGLTLGGILGFLAIVPVSALTRLRPARDIAVALHLARGLAFASYLLVSSAAGFFVVVALVAVVDRPASAVNQLLVAETVAAGERTTTMAALHVATNLGISAGALLGSLALLMESSASYTVVILADAASFWAAAWLLAKVPVVAASTSAAAPRLPGHGALAVLRDRRFTTMTFANAVICLHIPLLNVVVPLWLAQRTEAPVALMGGLLLLNTLLVVGFQLRVSRRVADVRTGARTAAVSGLLLAGACACVAVAANVGPVAAVAVLAVGVALLTVGEIGSCASGWALSFGMAPEDARRPSYLSMFALGPAAASVFGPAVLAFAVFRSTAAGWLVLMAVLVAAGLVARAAAGDQASSVRSGQLVPKPA